MPAPNALADEEQATNTPSRRDGVPEDIEEELCVYGCQLIQQAGLLLGLPQVAMGTAQVLFRRFWYVSSLKQFNVHDMCMGALVLAAKLEEKPTRLREVLLVFDYLLQRSYHLAKHNPGLRTQQLRGTKTVPPDDIPKFRYRVSDYYAQAFYDARDATVVAEMQLLKRLGFHVQVDLPYTRMVNYLQIMGVAECQLQSRNDPAVTTSTTQLAWNYLTDALQTPVYCLFPPHAIACASIYLLTMDNSVLHAPLALPLEPAPWWTLFDVERREMRAIASHILRLYDAEDVGDQRNSRVGVGLAARVREMQGSLVELGHRGGLRAWLQRSTPSTAAP